MEQLEDENKIDIYKNIIGNINNLEQIVLNFYKYNKQYLNDDSLYQMRKKTNSKNKKKVLLKYSSYYEEEQIYFKNYKGDK